MERKSYSLITKVVVSFGLGLSFSSIVAASVTAVAGDAREALPSLNHQLNVEIDALARGNNSDVTTRKNSSLQGALDREIQSTPLLPAPNLAYRSPIGTFCGGSAKLLDISADILFSAGFTNLNDEPLLNLQAGNHDPNQNGFTLQQVELSLVGAVDPYFDAEAHVLYFIDPEGESRTELEEAFFLTRSLPWNLQLEGGFFLTEFGRLNPMHPHEWYWLDQPVINTRLFGPDGIRQAGFRLGWILPTCWFSQLHVGIQNARGETMVSFLANDEFYEERGIGGVAFTERNIRKSSDFVYLGRFENSWDFCHDTWVALFGMSMLSGPNSSGSDGCTNIYGVDLTLKWRPERSTKGRPFFIWQTEVMRRDFNVDRTNPFANYLDHKLVDYGLYSYCFYGCTERAGLGFRFEYAGGSGNSFDPEAMAIVPRNHDPFRDNRIRLSPMFLYQLSEFSRIRLQVNSDWAQHLKYYYHEQDDQKHHCYRAWAVWLGFEVGIGAHPAHKF